MVSLAILACFGLGSLALWEFGLAFARFWELLIALLFMPFAIIYDIKRARDRRREHPDNNFHGLELLNAVGFNKHGAPILPGTPEAVKLEARRERERQKLEDEIKRSKP